MTPKSIKQREVKLLGSLRLAAHLFLIIHTQELSNCGQACLLFLCWIYAVFFPTDDVIYVDQFLSYVLPIPTAHTAALLWF